MLKKIHVKHLVEGMYIKEMCGSWMEHPFWRTSFLLDDPKDLTTLQASSVREVWIDTDRGLDVQEAANAVMEAQSEAEVEASLESAAAGERIREDVPMAEELTRAAKVCAKAKQAVTSMFQEARMGKAVDTALARKVVEEITDSVTRNAGALISLARLKNADDYTYMHSVAVCALMVALGRQLGLDEAQLRSAGIAGLVHDLGKAAMPLEVLNKPGKLTDDEFAIMKTHPEAGHRMLLETPGVLTRWPWMSVCITTKRSMAPGIPRGWQETRSVSTPRWARSAMSMTPSPPTVPTRPAGIPPSRSAGWRNGPTGISIPPCSRPSSRVSASTRSDRWCAWTRARSPWWWSSPGARC